MIKAAKAMVKCLEKEGIKVVFGYPGAAICPFYDALTNSDIRHILVRHEQNAGHAASGYARISGKPAVCIATSGPGALNLITAIATAYMDSVPMVIITGQVSSDQIGRDVFQEADITGSAEPFVKHSYLVSRAEELPKIFKEAFYIAGTGRPGPVLIDIPVDIQDKLIDFDYPNKVEIRSYKPTTKGNKLQIKRVLKAVEEAKKPLICAGGGIFHSGAKDELNELVNKSGIPVVTTMMGISSVSSDNPLYYGMLGMHGVKAANKAVVGCDLLILIGARVGDRAVKTPDFLGGTKKIIHIDIDPAEIGKNMRVDIPLVGDAREILSEINKLIPKNSYKEWTGALDELRVTDAKLCGEEKFINPRVFIRTLSEKMPDNTVCVADVGQNQIWTSNNFKIKNGRFLTSGGMGTMGYSVPCAVGAKLANPQNTVIAICGDGSFQMQMMELATICQHEVPLKIVIMKNNRLGMVREVQTRAYENNLTAVFLDGSPDFIKLADAYGIKGELISEISQADEAINRLINSDGPYIIVCEVSPEEATL